MLTKMGDVATGKFSIWAVPTVNLNCVNEREEGKPLFEYKVYHQWEKPYTEGSIRLGDIEIKTQVPIGVDLFARCMEQLNEEKAAIVKKYMEDIETVNIQIAHLQLLTGPMADDFIPAVRESSKFDEEF